MKEPGIVLTEEEKKRRRARSIAIALALVAFAVLLYFVTIVRMGPGILERPL
jgi:archaellum biogenesis protein FlaJ (TadC family)